MTIPLTSIKPLFLSHMLIARENTEKNMFAAFMLASGVWPTYSEKLLRLADDLRGDKLSKEEKASSAYRSMVLLASAKNKLAEEDLKTGALIFAGALLDESKLTPEQFADIVGFDNDDLHAAMLKFATQWHKEKQDAGDD